MEKKKTMWWIERGGVYKKVGEGGGGDHVRGVVGWVKALNVGGLVG